MKMILNGTCLSVEDARISPFDHGYLYGMGVFETFRTYKGEPFLLGRHMKRLKQGLEEMKIAAEIDEQQIQEWVTQLLLENGEKDGYFRLNISAGVRDIGLDPSPYEAPTTMLLMKKLPAVPAQKKGQVLRQMRNTPETGERLKSHHYFNNLAARRELTDGAGTEGLFLTASGALAEGITSNVFWIKGDTLFTPAIATGILRGVTRDYVMELAREAGMQVREGFYAVSELEEAEEAFVTNSIQEIVRLSGVDDAAFPVTEGGWTAKLQQHYRQHAEGKG